MADSQKPVDDDEGAIPAPGTVLRGKYRIEHVLGRGGMGTVVAAKHLTLGQTVAIKVLSGSDATRSDATERFLREGRAAARLRSDHVVRIYDVDTSESGTPFMVMELLRGMDFATLLAAHGPIPFEEAIELVVQACHALAEAHREGIVHRDVKPSNLFLTERSDGTALVKVLDFGIAKALDESGSESTLTATRSVMGSPMYMSPEQVRSVRGVDQRSDIWSIGVVLHELVTGQPAFQGETFPGICAAIAADPPASLRSSRPDAPPELERIVLRCLEKDPLLRFQTVDELADALRTLLAGADREESRLSGASLLGAALSAERAPFSETEPSQESTRDDGTTLLSAGSDRRPKEAAKETTLQSTTAGAAVSEPEVRPSRVGRALPAVLVGGALVVGAVIFVGRQSAVETTPSAVPEADHAPVAESFELLLQSVPDGARVTEEGRVLGVTPLQVVINRKAVIDRPRRFTVAMDGYEPYTLSQGDSAANVRARAVLTRVVPATPPAVPSASSPPVPAVEPRPVTHPRPRPEASKPPPQPSATAPEIRLSR